MGKYRTTPVKGTSDINPKQMNIIQNMLNIIREVYTRNGFNQIQTPILENIELLTSGDDGDNSKIMFKTLKRGAKLDLSKPNLKEQDLAEEGLRYDLTVPLSRFYAGNINDLPKPFKALQIGESFRAEKPQNGRDREFTQCDIDMFGESSNMAEIDLLLTAFQAYQALGIKNVCIKINDRRILNSLISFAGFSSEQVSKVLVAVDKLDKIGFEGVEKELQDQDFEKEKIRNFLQSIMQINSNGIDDCKKYGCDESIVKNLKEIIDTVAGFICKDYSIIFDISIIRGQSYYTGPVFEACCVGSSFTRAIGGGGRYDNMVEKYVSIPTPAVGFSIGLLPCSILIAENGLCAQNSKKKIAIIYSEDSDKIELMNKKFELMKNFDVCILPESKNFKNMLIRLSNIGYDGIYKFNQSKLMLFGTDIDL